MSHITTEQALQIPQQLRRQGSNPDPEQAPNTEHENTGSRRPLLTDDPVTLRRLQSQQMFRNVQVESYKSEVGQDSSYVKETLRNKLSEYNLSPNTRLTVSKDLFGNIEVKGTLMHSDLEQINADLNGSETFKEAFNRLSQQQPTLNYVDNVVKLSKAYGVGNSLFNSLVSEESEFNKLNDIAHRYQAMKSSNDPADSGMDSGDNRFQFVLNG